MKIIIRSNQESIIMDLPYEEILKLLEILKQDKSNYSKTISLNSYKATKEDLEFIKYVINYDCHIECQIHTP